MLGLSSEREVLLGAQIVEIEDHPYFVAVQFHPEFKSRPGKPSPPFLGEEVSPGLQYSMVFSPHL